MIILGAFLVVKTVEMDPYKLCGIATAPRTTALRVPRTSTRWTKFSSIPCLRAEKWPDFLPSHFRYLRLNIFSLFSIFEAVGWILALFRELEELCNILKAIYLQPLKRFEHMEAFAFLTRYRPDLDGLASIFGDSKGKLKIFIQRNSQEFFWISNFEHILTADDPQNQQVCT